MLFTFQTRNQASKPEIKPQNTRKNLTKFGRTLDGNFGGSRRLLGFGLRIARVQDVQPAHSLLMLFRFQARNQPSK